jgi:hypothetical protein
MTSSESPDLVVRLRGLISLFSVPLLRKALRAASGDTSSSSSSIWACDLNALCRSEAYDSPSSSRSSPGPKMSDSKSCLPTSSHDSVRPGRERLDRGMVGANVLGRRRAVGGLQGVPSRVHRNVPGWAWCLPGEIASETRSSVLPGMHMFLAEKMKARPVWRGSPQQQASKQASRQAGKQ